MLISHSHRFIFVHIQKTAGQSLKDRLRPFCNQPPRTGLRKLYSHLPLQEDPAKVAFREHATARWARLKLTPRLFDSYRVFTVVRNPFDRAVSNYHYLREKADHHSHRHVRDLTFDQYLGFLKERRWLRNPTQRFRVVGADGRLLCDPILRFENLEGDFGSLCRGLELPCEAALPRRNASTHRPWREYYERRATRDAAVNLFGDDFDTFEYPTDI
jgi:Sulfotransferase family